MFIFFRSFTFSDNLIFVSHDFISFQKTDYCEKQTIMKRADFFKQWQIDRYADIATYRDKCFASAETGTMGVKLKMPWIDFKDDSTEAFFDGLESSSEEQQEEKSKNDEP